MQSLILGVLIVLAGLASVSAGKQGGDNACTTSSTCAVGEGDCDKDSQCTGSLKCGHDNCDRSISSFDSTDDCCYKAGGGGGGGGGKRGECGKPKIQGTRVIGGKNAVRGSWPWQILLRYNNRPMCGGSLISPTWVVTAAHCISGRERYPGSFSVRAGEFDRNVPEGSEKDIQVQKFFKNSGYNRRTLDNDIALLKLSKPFLLNDKISTVCLPNADPPVGTDCYITGWGKITHPGSMTRYLQQGKLPVVSNTVCNRKNYPSIGIKVTKAMVCGGDGGKSRLSGCHGDSGGPYVCKIGGRWELHGAVSHGSGTCSSTKTYSVFARVAYFKNWIKTTMEANKS